MADRGDTHYHVPHLNLWFLGSSAFFLLTMIWTVVDDWDAEWKDYQRDFRALELALSESDLASLDAAGAVALEEQLLANVEAVRQGMTSIEKEIDEKESAVYELKETRFKIEEAFKKMKSVLNWEIFLIEDDVVAGDMSADEMDAHLSSYRLDVNAAELAFEDANTDWEDGKKELETLRADLTAAEVALAEGSRDLQRVRDKIESLDPSDFATKAANVVRDFPGLDFIGPNLKITKQVLDDLTFELNFTKKTRIDMCTTCHVGIDRAGFEGDVIQPILADLGMETVQPHSAHPRLDLFLTSKSPHPIKKVGCTICHRGSGESLSFQHADHRPSDKAEQAEWEAKYHWHKQHHWDYPMLPTKSVEAGCVQCHKTSMELIADDAPTVTEGYRLFETKGCYACHKVDWFPTTRRPGPTLENLAAKLTPEFANAWIGDPRGFRPSTHMPQIFHLENLPPEDEVVVSNYGKGRPILGQEWNENAVAAITSFLFANHPVRDLEPLPSDLEGDAARGREAMNVSGCFACHNTSPWDADDYDGVPAISNEVTEHNVMGPNLRGVATKLNKTWLYHWVKDPTTYWPETRMPNLRLSAQDALDIATYITDDPDGIFSDVPEGWEPAGDPGSVLDLDVLQEQARWFFQKDGRRALEQRFAGDDENNRWDDAGTLAVAVGQALVTNHGCFSCHTVTGMENYMPIGTELTTWASKTVDKLDFGLSYLKQLDENVELLDHHYNDGWLEQKLRRPRFFDLDKVKTPKDKLRMPSFDFTDHEVEVLATFVQGLVIDETQLAQMNPTPEQVAMEEGMRAVRQNNCKSCHIVEPSTVTFQHDGSLVTAEAEVMPPFPSYSPLPPRMDSLSVLRADLRQAAEWAEEDEVEEITIRLNGVHPDVGAPNEKVTFGVDDLVAVSATDGGSFVRHMTEYYMLGTFVRNPDYDPSDEDDSEFWRWTLGYDSDQEVNLVEDVDGEQRPYGGEGYDKVRWTFAPPVLLNEGHKLQTEWFYAFLEDPVPLREQLRVRMPSFHYDTGEAEAIADYFAEKARWDWYERYAKTLRLSLGRETEPKFSDGSTSHAWDLPRQAHEWPTMAFVTKGTGPSFGEFAELMAGDQNALSASMLESIESGFKPDVLANFGKLHAWGTSRGFDMTGQLKQGHEMVDRRTPTHLAQRAEFIGVGEAVGAEGVNCFQCHLGGPTTPETPIAWAPNLENVRSRLREEWVREWQWSPALIYQGTAMPDNFNADQPQYQEQYPNSTNADQIQAILDWLYNMDRPSSK